MRNALLELQRLIKNEKRLTRETWFQIPTDSGHLTFGIGLLNYPYYEMVIEHNNNVCGRRRSLRLRKQDAYSLITEIMGWL